MSTVNTQGGGRQGRAGPAVGEAELPAAWSVPSSMSMVSTHGTRQLVEDEKQAQRKFFERETLGTRIGKTQKALGFK